MSFCSSLAQRWRSRATPEELRESTNAHVQVAWSQSRKWVSSDTEGALCTSQCHGQTGVQVGATHETTPDEAGTKEMEEMAAGQKLVAGSGAVNVADL